MTIQNKLVQAADSVTNGKPMVEQALAYLMLETTKIGEVTGYDVRQFLIPLIQHLVHNALGGDEKVTNKTLSDAADLAHNIIQVTSSAAGIKPYRDEELN